MQVTRRSAAARRAEIIEATIETLADVGYQRTSFSAITERAQISSTRLISYHFTDRADLMSQVAAQVIGELGAAVERGVRAADSPREAVRCYIKANLEYMDLHRSRMRALTSLLFAGALTVPTDLAGAGVEALTDLIRAGQRSGQFGDVDPEVAATIVQATIEGVALRLRDHPAIDLGGHTRKLVRFFDAALGHPAPEQARP